MPLDLNKIKKSPIMAFVSITKFKIAEFGILQNGLKVFYPIAST